MNTPNSPAHLWATAWLDAVVAGAATMSQRKLSSVEKRGGGLPVVRELAREKGVHLLLFTDDQGNELVAASRHPFQMVC